MEPDEYRTVLQRANARFADAAAAGACWRTAGRRGYPGCPDWTLADLVWHLAEVQHFWAWMVRTRAAGPVRLPGARAATGRRTARLPGRAERGAGGRAGRRRPCRAGVDLGAQQDVAFVLRRQAQEAVVHAVDAEQVLGDVRPIPPTSGLDGLDEWLDVMVPSALPEGPPESAHPVVFHAVDAAAERTLFPGTRPFPIAALTGNAGDLLLAVWRRVPMEVLTVDGDGAAGRRDDRPRHAGVTLRDRAAMSLDRSSPGRQMTGGGTTLAAVGFTASSPRAGRTPRRSGCRRRRTPARPGSSICQNVPMSRCRVAPSDSRRSTSAGMSSVSMSTCQRGGVPAPVRWIST